jgi:hypothetical protein
VITVSPIHAARDDRRLGLPQRCVQALSERYNVVVDLTQAPDQAGQRTPGICY